MKETEIEKEILIYLEETYRNSKVMKINVGGKPIFKDGKMKLIPFKSKYSPIGISDIIFIKDSIIYFFEVKTPQKMKFIKKNYARFKGESPKQFKQKEYERICSQVNFIESVKEVGARAFFVSSIDDVKNALKD